MIKGFQDVPKDVLWLICVKLFRELPSFRRWNDAVKFYSEPHAFSNIFNCDITDVLMTFALIDKRTFALLKSKCVKIDIGWLFKKGALPLTK